MRDKDRVYRDVPLEQKEQLFTFRTTHSYHEVDVHGVACRYVACGRGDKALLLLPGAFLRADMWFNQILALEGAYRIIAPDAFALQGVFDIHLICDALVRSLDAEGIERATVIGLSAGGWVAQVLLQRHPERVGNAVFSHCGALEHCAETETKTKRILRVVRLLPLFAVRRVLKRMTRGEIPLSSPWIAFHEAYMREAITHIDRAMVLRFLQSSLETRQQFTFEPQVLASWHGSILLLSSKDDALSRPSLEKLQARYPRAQTDLLEAGGHHAFLFFPHAYTAALRKFLDQTS